MLKVIAFITTLAGLSMGLGVAGNAHQAPLEDRNAKIIVELDRSLDSLTEEGVNNTQEQLLRSIKKNVTGNIEVINRYTEIGNAFALSINKEYIAAVRSLPGVKSVTVDSLHWKTTVYKDGTVSRSTGGEYGDDENISATTMKKSDDTNDGEGTLIAILDNEFYLRGVHEMKELSLYRDGALDPLMVITVEKDVENKIAFKRNGIEIDPERDVVISKNVKQAWNHETFTALEPYSVDAEGKEHGVALKVPDKKRPSGYAKTFASARVDAAYTNLSKYAGYEGSQYYNTKVPFYFDYGGEALTYSDGDFHPDNDVSSESSYHGSHVASIAAGNAPDYKGIAPKAQLALMKVFTNFDASIIDGALGVQSYSGAYDIPILNALEDCLKMEVDGINMSLGSNLGDFEEDSFTFGVLNSFRENGIMTSISAGNSGKASYNSVGAYANWTSDMVETGILGSYANSESTIVAAGQPTKLFYENAFKVNGQVVAYDDQIVNRPGDDSQYDKEHKIADEVASPAEFVYVPGFGTSADYAKLGNISGKIAVVNRGSTSFEEKYQQASARNVAAMIIINNDPTSNEFNFRCSFGDTQPDIPVALVLYKDKGIFADAQKGTMEIVSKQIFDNPNALTPSTFSTDGARFDLELKPDITTPGENIRGAVPPQKKEDASEERRLHVYEYLSGTSMAAPNYAGAQSVVLSKVSGPIYKEAAAKGKTPKDTEKALINEFKNTVDMRLMSTAEPMLDPLENGDIKANGRTISSPRKQGAGMVNLGNAYSTEVYLEGLDELGQGVNKAKISLKNNADINAGNISLDFLAHNESNEDRKFNVTYTVMRPAIVKNNDIVTSSYNDKGEITDKYSIPGLTHWQTTAGETELVPEQITNKDKANKNDVIYISKDIEYFATAEELINNTPSVFKKNRYVNVGTADDIIWQVYEGSLYQSAMDVEIAKVDCGSVVVKANGTTTISLKDYSLTAQQREDIAEFFDYGCFIEGYVTLKSADSHENLSIPYMGYYSSIPGGDINDAPVVEPFSFEKEEDRVYPSDLVNALAKDLVGKTNIDMGSMWLTGYLKQGSTINIEQVLKNDDNFSKITGFRPIATDPSSPSNALFDDPNENLYAGNAYGSNTMIIQQFVLRSVKDNYITLTNKTTGEVVYKDVLQDMLFSSSEDVYHYALYKSHVDDTYLGAGYLAHRAYAIVPLYNQDNGQAFPAGEYEMTFHYMLATNREWVSTSYDIHLDSEAPEVSSINVVGNDVKININEKNISAVSVGGDVAEFVDNGNGTSTVTMDKDELVRLVNENMNYYRGSGSLYLKITDKAFGVTGCIVRFEVVGEDEDYNPIYNLANYTMLQNPNITKSHDFIDLGNTVQLVKNDGQDTPVTVDGPLVFSRGPLIHGGNTVTSKGCGGNILTTSITLSALSLTSIIAICIAKAFKKKKYLGGK
ncbi:MAG: S8 family serine peptidase [Bacilli bacterium]|nr:S8 family serine peptidase [Bacilli bacterium]